MANDIKEHEENTITENLSAVGQIVLGEIESIGGILTGDPVTRAEGDFNADAGFLHQKSNRVLTEIENNQETPNENEIGK